jgi:hypothetical protein
MNASCSVYSAFFACALHAESTWKMNDSDKATRDLARRVMGAFRHLDQLFDPNTNHERQKIHSKDAVVNT